MAFKISNTIVIDDSQNIIVGSGTTAERPASPVTGTLWFNTSLGILEGWTGSIWEQLTLT
jgi:hypothetical protein